MMNKHQKFFYRLHSLYQDDNYQSHPLTNVLVLSQDYVTMHGKISKRYTFVPYHPSHIPITNNNMYEVLHEDLPRNFYMDIDIKKDNPLFNKFTYHDIVEAAKTAVRITLHDAFSISNDLSNTIVFVVKHATEKQSLHIIFPSIAFRRCKDAKFFSRVLESHVHQHAPDHVKNVLCHAPGACIIDFRVYSRNQNFRLPYNSKLNKNKLILEPFYPIQQQHEHLVGIYGSPPSEHQYLPVDGIKLANEGIKALIKLKPTTTHKLTEPELKDFATYGFDVLSELQQYSDDQIPTPNYDSPSREAFILSCIPNSNQKPQSFTVWYAIGQTLRNLAHEQPARSQELLHAWITWSKLASDIYPDEDTECQHAWDTFTIRKQKWGFNFLTSIARFYHPNAVITKYNILNTFADMFDMHKHYSLFTTSQTYDDAKYMKPLDLTNYDLIACQGPMGSGKTTQIKALSHTIKPQRILMIGSRQTFCKEKVADFSHTWSDIIDYTDELVQSSYDWLMFDKLVIQVESLHRLRFIDDDSTYDLLILDEIESILYQFISDTQKHPMRCFEVFMQLLLTSKKIVMADAFLTNRTMTLVKDLLSMRNLKSKLDINTFNPNSHITANIIGVAYSPNQLADVKDAFTQHIVNSILDGKKICVVCASKAFKDHIKHSILNAIGNDNVHSIFDYDANTDDAIIEDLGNINSTWAHPEIKLVIYTTKITVGISFDIPDVFNNIYIYGTVTCPIVRDLMQAHFRVRNIKDNNIYIAINACNINNSTKRQGIAHTKSFVSSIYNTYCYNDAMEQEEVDAVYRHVTTYNVMEENVGSFAYEKLFVHYLEKIGYKVAYSAGITPQDSNITYDSILPDGYMANYIQLRSIPQEDMKLIDRFKRSSMASSDDKKAANAFFFYNTVIRKTKLFQPAEHTAKALEADIMSIIDSNLKNQLTTRACVLDQTFLEQLECDMFNEYTSNSKFKSHVHHVIDEVKVQDMQERYRETAHGTITQQKNTIRLEYIKNLVCLLGLKTSFDNTLVLNDKSFEPLLKYYINLDDTKKMQLKELFCIRLRGKTITKQTAFTIACHMLEHWNGCTIDRVNRRKTMGKWLYEYKVVHGSLLFAAYCSMLKAGAQ